MQAEGWSCPTCMGTAHLSLSRLPETYGCEAPGKGSVHLVGRGGTEPLCPLLCSRACPGTTGYTLCAHSIGVCMDVRRAQSHTHGGNWLPQPCRSLCRCHCPLHSQPGTGLGWAVMSVWPNLALPLGKALSETGIRSKGKSSPLASSSCPGAEWNRGHEQHHSSSQWCWKPKVS